MALILNEEQQSLKDIAKDFLEKNAPVNHFREIRDSANETGYSQELWKQMAELGWAGILVSEEYGGFEFGISSPLNHLNLNTKNLAWFALDPTIQIIVKDFIFSNPSESTRIWYNKHGMGTPIAFQNAANNLIFRAVIGK